MTEAENASSSTSKILSFWILTWLSTTASSSSTWLGLGLGLGFGFGLG